MLSYFDFVIGENIEIGKSITEYSRKLQNNAEKDGHRTTESYVQTNFVYIINIIGRLSPSSRFRKNPNRK
jgi:uncharacterized membrane protein YqgA involved in biofilm formation